LFSRLQAGQEPLEFDLIYAARLPDVLRHSVVLRPPEAAELERKLNMSLAELELSVRATNCLESEGITTVRDLILRNDEELLEVRNFGETTLREVKNKLAERGLRLVLGPILLKR
jgi:DNA-directed RNA polymerase alpha subunit